MKTSAVLLAILAILAPLVLACGSVAGEAVPVDVTWDDATTKVYAKTGSKSRDGGETQSPTPCTSSRRRGS